MPLPSNLYIKGNTIFGLSKVNGERSLLVTNESNGGQASTALKISNDTPTDAVVSLNSSTNVSNGGINCLNVKNNAPGAVRIVEASGNGLTIAPITGAGTFSGDAEISGDLNIVGNIAKATGTFDITHPDPSKSNLRLRHSFVESNTRGDNLYRYTVTTDELKASIELPDYFEFLNENVQVFVSGVSVLGNSRGIVIENEVKIDVSVDGIYNVLVVGTRKDSDAVKNFDPKGVVYDPSQF